MNLKKYLTRESAGRLARGYVLGYGLVAIYLTLPYTGLVANALLGLSGGWLVWTWLNKKLSK